MTIIQVDGAYYNRYQYCNVGIYIDKGLEEIDQITVKGINCYSSDSAEAIAVLEGMRKARTRGFKNIEIQTDFKPLIDHLEGLNPEPMKSSPTFDVNKTVEYIRDMEQFFDSVGYRWISRKQNNAHALSRR